MRKMFVHCFPNSIRVSFSVDVRFHTVHLNEFKYVLELNVMVKTFRWAVFFSFCCCSFFMCAVRNIQIHRLTGKKKKTTSLTFKYRSCSIHQKLSTIQISLMYISHYSNFFFTFLQLHLSNFGCKSVCVFCVCVIMQAVHSIRAMIQSI